VPNKMGQAKIQVIGCYKISTGKSHSGSVKCPFRSFCVEKAASFGVSAKAYHYNNWRWDVSLHNRLIALSHSENKIYGGSNTTSCIMLFCWFKTTLLYLTWLNCPSGSRKSCKTDLISRCHLNCGVLNCASGKTPFADLRKLV